MPARELVVIGGGPAGLSAAIEAKKLGVEDVLVIDRESEPGGILKQCIHPGFGLHVFKEELTGTEYAERQITEARDLGVEIMLDTMVIELTADRRILAVNSSDGLLELKAGAVILAMGCRERTRGAINIPGYRPAGIFTAGVAQYFMNVEGYIPGREVVILGSGDVGLIMARHLALEGARVKSVVEIMPYPSGLIRNVVQCLQDFDIPLLLNHTVVDIHGRDRVEGVTIAEVDQQKKPKLDTARHIACDTLLLSIGLIPENELSRMARVEIDGITGGPVVDQNMQTSVEGIFACGNVLHVHDVVDWVTIEARVAARGAAGFLRREKARRASTVQVTAGEGLRYVLPQKIDLGGELEETQKFFMRSLRPMDRARLLVRSDKGVVMSRTLRSVRPSEMISIKVKREILEQKGHLEISLHEGSERGA